MIIQENNVYDRYNDLMKTDGICGTLTAACGITTACGCFYVIEHEENKTDINYIIIQKCGDRDKDGNYSCHDYSNCLPANPMSDRGQLLVEYKNDNNR